VKVALLIDMDTAATSTRTTRTLAADDDANGHANNLGTAK
jgi:hypothetical protein